MYIFIQGMSGHSSFLGNKSFFENLAVAFVINYMYTIIENII